MNRFVCVLRGINVGGKRKILMQDLRDLLSNNGFQSIKTYIQSGNIGFDSEEENNSKLELLIQQLIEKHYGFTVPVLVILQNKIQNIVDNLPYDTEEHIHVTFLQEAPKLDDIKQINPSDYHPEEFKIIEQVVYLKCVEKYHQTKLSNNFFEKKLKISATTRNWKTVKKLAEL